MPSGIPTIAHKVTDTRIMPIVFAVSVQYSAPRKPHTASIAAQAKPTRVLRVQDAARNTAITSQIQGMVSIESRPTLSLMMRSNIARNGSSTASPIHEVTGLLTAQNTSCLIHSPKGNRNDSGHSLSVILRLSLACMARTASFCIT